MKKMMYYATGACDAIAFIEGVRAFVFAACNEDPLLDRCEDKDVFCEKAKDYLISNADNFDFSSAGWERIIIGKNDDIEEVLGIEEVFAEVELDEETVKYWLDLYDPALNGYYDFSLCSIGDNDVIYEGRKSDVLESLGISEEEMGEHEDDSFFIDKLDEFFEKELGIQPEEWEVG